MHASAAAHNGRLDGYANGAREQDMRMGPVFRPCSAVHVPLGTPDHDTWMKSSWELPM